MHRTKNEWMKCRLMFQSNLSACPLLGPFSYICAAEIWLAITCPDLATVVPPPATNCQLVLDPGLGWAELGRMNV